MISSMDTERLSRMAQEADKRKEAARIAAAEAQERAWEKARRKHHEEKWQQARDIVANLPQTVEKAARRGEREILLILIEDHEFRHWLTEVLDAN
jgi:hypothetical protein